MNRELPLEIECEAVRARLEAADGLVLIDCREPDEHATAQIAGARLIPMSQLEALLGELQDLREVEIAVHCHHGGRSLRVVRWLREQGLPQAQSMAGGIDRWSQVVDPSVPRY
ncbi:MAG: rhodanese-like domain-containing protein [Pirellulales bacterium]